MAATGRSVEKAVLVVDMGSYTCKAGFTGDDAPLVVFPSVVGRPRKWVDMDRTEPCIGPDAMENDGLLTLTYPMSRGVSTNWEDVEKIWHHTFFCELRIDPSVHPLLVTEPVLNPKRNRELLLRMMFDVFNVPSIQITFSGLPILAASGRTTGIVVDSGDSVTQCMPMYKGYMMPHGVQRLNVAGRDLTELMMRLLTYRNIHIEGQLEREVVRELKEKACYVSLDPALPIEWPVRSWRTDDARYMLGMYRQVDDWQGDDAEYMLSDGQVATLARDQQRLRGCSEDYVIPKLEGVCGVNFCLRGMERSLCAEALFRPLLIGVETPGIHEIIFQSIFKCDRVVRSGLFANVVLAGGTTMLGGMGERLEKELKALAPPSTEIHVAAPPERKLSLWTGSSAQASSFQGLPRNRWISKEEYCKAGPSVANLKCF